MNYTKLFYWLVVADNARTFFTTFMVIFTIFSVISTLFFIFSRNGDDLSAKEGGTAERAKKWMWWSYPFAVLFWGLFTFTPSKKDALFVVAGGETLNYLSTDSTAKQLPKEFLGFIKVNLQQMASEAKIEISNFDAKQKIVDEAKRMTPDELINRMKTDSTFKSIILNQ